MKSVKQILDKFNPAEDKYISREFQSFGIHLAESLDDYKHKSLYIKLAKTVHRSILEKALSFAVDSNARNKGALFMWKMAQIKSGSSTNSCRSPSGTIRTGLTERISGTGTTDNTNNTNLKYNKKGEV